MIEVVTVYTPRPKHEKYIDFVPMIALQKRTAEKFGHRHVVVTDQVYPQFNVVPCKMPISLMLSIMIGQLHYLENVWTGEHPLVLVDADCLIARPLDAAFDGTFDLGLTRRLNDKAPINNGAMYVAAGTKEAVVAFFRKALPLTRKHWGGDQEAISQAAAPVPAFECVEMRDGLRVGFLSMITHNVIPRERGAKHKKNPFIVHFKGVEAKAWMATYAEKFIL